MTQYNTLNVKLVRNLINQDQQQQKTTEATLKFSSNMIGDSNDDTNFPHELLLTDRQISKLRKTFANNSSANTKLSKNHLSKRVQSGEFSGRFLEPLLKSRLSLMKNIFKSLQSKISQ